MFVHAEISLQEHPVLWTADPHDFLQDEKSAPNIDLTEHPDHCCFDAVYTPPPTTSPGGEKTLEPLDCMYPLCSANKSAVEHIPQDSLERLFSCGTGRSISWQNLLGRRVYTLNRRRSSLDCGVVVSYEENGTVRIVYDHETLEHNIQYVNSIVVTLYFAWYTR